MSTPRRTKQKRKAAKLPPKVRTLSGGRRKGKGNVEIIVRGILARGGKVLMCRNVKHGHYYLPGGHVDPFESAHKALAREFLEECGLRVRVGSLALVTEATFEGHDGEHHEINLVFHVELPGTDDKAKDLWSLEKHIAFDWIDPAAAPELDIRPPSAKAFIASGGRGSAAGAEWVSEIG